MPLLATLDGTTRIDATQVDDATWAAIHKVTPRRELTCRECGWRLRAVRRRASGLRFFAHDPAAPECSTVGESDEHIRLKTLIADVARRAPGWDALLEEPVGRRRADVLATDGRRTIAFEVQLSTQDLEMTVARTADYRAASVEVVWVVRRHAAIGRHEDSPWLQLGARDLVVSPLARHREQNTHITLAGRRHELRGPWWEPATRPVDLTWVMHALLDHRLLWHEAGRCWAPAGDVDAHAQSTLRYEQEANHLRRIHAAAEEEYQRWLRRREQTLTHVLDLLDSAGHGTPHVKGPAETRGYGEAHVLETRSALLIAVCPRPGRDDHHRLAQTTVLTADADEAAALSTFGVDAQPWRSFTPPKAALVRPDGQHDEPATYHAWRRISDTASRADLVLGDPRWDAGRNLWVMPAGEHTIALVPPRGTAPADPPTGSAECTWIIYSRPRDVVPTDRGNAGHAGQITVEHLRHPSLPLRAPQPSKAKPSVRPIAQVGAMADPVKHAAYRLTYELLPRGHTRGRRLLDRDAPHRGSVLSCAGPDIVITARPDLLAVNEVAGKVLLALGGEVQPPIFEKAMAVATTVEEAARRASRRPTL
jgi:hypothetical protein